MPLEDLIITVFCWVEERLESLLGKERLRQRSFAPKLADSEVLTMEGVGEFWGWIPMSVSGATSVVTGGRGFPRSDRAPPWPSKRPSSGGSSNGFIAAC